MCVCVWVGACVCGCVSDHKLFKNDIIQSSARILLEALLDVPAAVSLP